MPQQLFVRDMCFPCVCVDTHTHTVAARCVRVRSDSIAGQRRQLLSKAAMP